MDLINYLSKQLGLKNARVSAAVDLLDAGNTVPFIARYRKEATGGLDEEQLRLINESLGRLRSLNERRQTVLKSIREQGKLTPELSSQIMAAETLTALEDLYQPFKPKRRTRASIAREKGLKPLADLILEGTTTGKSLDELAAPFLNADVSSFEQAWAGARDIVAEMISDRAELRRDIRKKATKFAVLQSVKTKSADDPKKVYEIYYDFETRVDRLFPHQVLAINRAENVKVLRVKVLIPEQDWRGAIERQYGKFAGSPLANEFKQAAEDGALRLLLPAIERDVRRELTERAEIHAIKVFAENLRALLNQPPISGYTVLGIDPGHRTGCKLAVVDSTGKVRSTGTVYPHDPQKEWDKTLKTLHEVVEKDGVTLIAIGNGTASRQTEKLVAELTRNHRALRYLIVNEAGASVYSASRLGRRELPDMDVSLRGAVSIARRALDPLAELVKIDPKSIGVGMYQHDVDQKHLAETLADVVESVVNRVGVDLNTASPALLTHVAGIGPKLAESITEYRDQQGIFTSRQNLFDVAGLGPKAFEQAAGFLRIPNGKNPLDASAIHPESYRAAEALMKKADLDSSMPVGDREPALDALIKRQPLEDLADEMKIGLPTLEDIIEQLILPGRDPRQSLPSPVLRDDILKMEDLSQGMHLRGTVRNVVDFGAFVDIGVKQDGLLHRSKIPSGIDLKVGFVIDVVILNIDTERGRIGLGWFQGASA